MNYSSLLEEQQQQRQKNHYHHLNNKTPEMNGLIEETAWKRIQMEKQFQKDKIRQVYKEKWNILNDIQQVNIYIYICFFLKKKYIYINANLYFILVYIIG